MNEHIARLQKIGLGKESTSGTAVAVAAWIPKSKGLLVASQEGEYDEGAYGNIDKNREYLVTKKWAQIQITDTQPRDVWIGHLLAAFFGQAWACVRFSISGGSGTFTEGETVTESTSSATGTLRRSDQSGGTSCLYIEPATGTFTGGQTLTGGTSGATATGGTIISPSAARHHIFRRKNDNNPVSYTIYAQDPVTGDERAAYCVLDTLDFEAAADSLVRFAATFMGRSPASTSTQTPTYAAENPFIGKHMALRLASAWTGLDAASVTAIERMKLQGMKNVEVVRQADGTNPPDPSSLHNTEFEMKGDFSALFDATTLRDLALAGTARAMRLTIANTSATALSGSTYPTLQFDFPQVHFNEWGKADDNAKIVRQNLGWTAVYNVSRSMTAEAMLINSRTTNYI